MPKADIKEEDFYAPADNGKDRSLVHSCSKPDTVIINGKPVIIKSKEEQKKENTNVWLKFDGLLRNAEQKIVGLIKKK